MTVTSPSAPVALVTGASSGIGAACAKALAAEGLNVAVNYASNDTGAREVVADCEDQGVRSVALKGDVGEDGVCASLVESALSAWGRLDVLVSNAGVTRFVKTRDLDGLDGHDFARIFAVNVTAAYELAKVAAPHLRTSPIGAIVNVSSHSGMSGLGSSHAYSASKGALNALTLGLARALAPEIRVNAVCPGYVETPWHAGKVPDPELLHQYMQGFADIAPLKRLTRPEDVAEAVVFFATGAKAITGELLVIDGGTHLAVATPESL